MTTDADQSSYELNAEQLEDRIGIIIKNMWSAREILRQLSEKDGPNADARIADYALGSLIFYSSFFTNLRMLVMIKNANNTSK